MTEPPITMYMNPWHLHHSPAFDLVLTQVFPRKPFVRKSILEYSPGVDPGPVVFCQDLPSSGLPSTAPTPYRWIPMLDGQGNQSKGLWDSLPKYLGVIAFSKNMETAARQQGLSVFPLKYYEPPAREVKSWNSKDLSLFYWNRSALLSPDALAALCRLLNVRTLRFRNEPDPYLPDAMAYAVPALPQETELIEISGRSSRETFLDALNQSDIFVAPRYSEGIGLTFIEAMAQGCAVLAVDQPTMNEYVEPGRNGALLPLNRSILEENWFALEQRRMLDTDPLGLLRGWRLRVLGRLRTYRPLIDSNDLDAHQLQSIDWKKYSHCAWQDSAKGNQAWNDRLNEYSAFLFGE